jgi:1,2-dihydroxy-3-keto-5-methylthiopentene dioxygenase
MAMSVLRIYTDHDITNLLFTTDSDVKIAAKLADAGVRFEQWKTNADIEPGAPAEDVIAAYQTDIDRLIKEDGYQTVDVVSLSADHPQKAEFRQKFLSEHTHSEDEVRFFVAGEGLFTLHIDEKVYEVHCTQGDLISVPANTTHWFDMGPNPGFVAIRLFNNPEGWVANFTGNNIAERFNRLEN